MTNVPNQPNPSAPMPSQPPQMMSHSTESRPTVFDSPARDTYVSNKKFNLVMYGIQENPIRTPRHISSTNDLSNCLCILKDINPSSSKNPVCNCTRLGKFTANSTRPRPILLTFITTIDVANVLLNWKDLASH